MSSSNESYRHICNGIVDGDACTKSLRCCRRFCSRCGKQNPYYEEGHNTDTSGSEEEFIDADDSQNNAQALAPLERHPDPLSRLHENNLEEDNDVFDSSSDDTGNTTEASPDAVELCDVSAYAGATDNCGSCSTHVSSDQIMEKLKQMLITFGPIETKRYINKMLNEWKKANVKIAITGSKKVGKSTFINMIRNIRPGEDGYAKSGSEEPTRTMTKYVDPKNSRIIYCDCPGVGHLRMPRDKFLEEVDLSSFDYFLIFFKNGLSTDDAWIAEQLTILNKPFCLVRSKLDEDIENEPHDKPVGKRLNEVEIVKGIREEAKLWMRTSSIFKDAKLFVISCRKPHLGEMASCVQHVTGTLPDAKYQAIMRSLPVSTKQVIEDKYDALKSRIPFVAVGTGIACAFTIIPGIGRFIVQNPIIKTEVQHYLKTFCLTEEYMKEIPGVQINANVPLDNTQDIKCRSFCFSPPIIGPAIEGALRVKDVLSKTLDSLKSSAYTVHKHCLEPNS